ncbi:MAG TPA: ABC transporter permease [Rhodanobacteraceae bacterium]|nr:ABC transporter permease [Rhodanobacteraceae bacterium]
MLSDDLRYSLRMLRKSPLASVAIVLTVALAVGATTAVFSVFNALILRPLPYHEPERLVWVAERNDKLNLPTFTTSGLNFRSWQAETAPIDSLAAIGFASYNLSGDGEPEQLTGGTLSAGVFPALGIAPLVGRAFSIDEEQVGGAPVVMIGEGLWRRRFGADPKLVGRTLSLDGTPHTVVGIAPAALTLISPGDVWKPLVIDPAKEKRLAHTLTAIGRLPSGSALQQSQAAMDAVAAHVGQQFPETRDWGIRLVPFPKWIVPDTLRTLIGVLLAAVGCVLLIAAANIANLMLARALARESEVAVRTAIGASRMRVVRQSLMESLLLSLAGGALGIAIAFAALRWAAYAMPPNLLPITDIGIDARVFAFAFALSVVTGLLFGGGPALRVARAHSAPILRAGGRGMSAGAQSWPRKSLLVIELALAAALLVVAGLLIRSLDRLEAVDLGFRPDHLLTFQLSLPQARDPNDARPFVFYRDLIPALAAVPGVSAAALSSGVPFGAGTYSATPVRPNGASLLAADDALTIDWRLASPDFFRTFGIPLLRGRTFTDADDARAPPVMIISRSMALKFWGTEDVLGHSVHRLGDGKDLTVVGVVGDIRLTALNTQAPTMYYSSASRLWPLMDVVVRTNGDPAAAIADVRARIRSLDANLPLANVRTMDEWVANSGAQPRLNAGLLGIFSALALVIAALGVYGVLAHSVGQRSGEIGLRMALGAQGPRLVGQFLREGLGLAGLGIALGLFAALAASSALEGLVFGITTRDAATYVVVAICLAVISGVACAIPARRAALVDPVVALRGE